MLEFISNPWILLIIVSPLMLLFGIVGGNVLSQPRQNQVLKVSPESHRGVELDVDKEDSINLYCKPVGNMPPQRFIKRLNSFNIMRKGWLKLQNYALWFGRYGTAYVHRFDNKDVDLSFKKAVFNVFGKKYYDAIPKDVKQRVEDGSIGVTVEFPDDPLTPDDYPSVSESDINRDNDQRAMENLWDTYESERRKSVIEKLAYVGTGISVGIIIMLITKWGSPVVVENILPPTIEVAVKNILPQIMGL